MTNAEIPRKDSAGSAQEVITRIKMGKEIAKNAIFQTHAVNHMPVQAAEVYLKGFAVNALKESISLLQSARIAQDVVQENT